jgi:H+/gluconate symporter-like permease
MMDMFFPPEVQKTLDSEFMGFKIWMIIIALLILPIPRFVIPIIIFMYFPGFKDKATNLIKNGISNYNSRITGDRYQVPPQGNAQDSPVA